MSKAKEETIVGSVRKGVKFVKDNVGLTDKRTSAEKIEDLQKQNLDLAEAAEQSKEERKNRKTFVGSNLYKLSLGYIFFSSLTVGILFLAAPALVVPALIFISAIAAIAFTAIAVTTAVDRAAQAFKDSGSPEKQIEKNINKIRELNRGVISEKDSIEAVQKTSNVLDKLLSDRTLNAKNSTDLGKALDAYKQAVRSTPGLEKFNQRRSNYISALEKLLKLSEQNRDTSGLKKLADGVNINDQKKEIVTDLMQSLLTHIPISGLADPTQATLAARINALNAGTPNEKELFSKIGRVLGNTNAATIDSLALQLSSKVDSESTKEYVTKAKEAIAEAQKTNAANQYLHDLVTNSIEPAGGGGLATLAGITAAIATNPNLMTNLQEAAKQVCLADNTNIDAAKDKVKGALKEIVRHVTTPAAGGALYATIGGATVDAAAQNSASDAKTADVKYITNPYFARIDAAGHDVASIMTEYAAIRGAPMPTMHIGGINTDNIGANAAAETADVRTTAWSKARNSISGFGDINATLISDDYAARKAEATKIGTLIDGITENADLKGKLERMTSEAYERDGDFKTAFDGAIQEVSGLFATKLVHFDENVKGALNNMRKDSETSINPHDDISVETPRVRGWVSNKAVTTEL